MLKKVGVMVEQPPMREGLKSLIQQAGLEFAGKFEPRSNTNADILVVGLSGYEEICGTDDAKLPMIVMGTSEEMTHECVSELVQEGVKGIATWNINPNDFKAGLRIVANGDNWVWSPLARPN